MYTNNKLKVKYWALFSKEIAGRNGNGHSLLTHSRALQHGVALGFPNSLTSRGLEHYDIETVLIRLY